jgi:hypothetical protein
MKKIQVLVCATLVLFSCNKQDVQVMNSQEKLNEAKRTTIVINEVSSNANLENEFGDDTDWIELYNTTNEDVILKEGDWSLSDNPAKPEKFTIPEVKIEANSHLVIWCDKVKKDGDDIHANFKISSKGETISLYHKGEVSDEVQFDSTDYSENSYARIKDGHVEWQPTEVATPNISND